MEKDTNHYEILVIEDNDGDFLLIEEYLEDYVLQPKLTQAPSYRIAEDILLTSESPSYDLIFLDLSLPDKSGNELVKAIKALSKNIPIVILTGYTDINLSISSLSLGADDYLLKDELTSITLYKSLIYNIERKKNIKALRNSEKRYSDLFHLSPLPMYVFSTTNLAIIDVNNAAITHYGYSREEFLSMTINDLLPKSDTEFDQELRKTAYVSDESDDFRIINHQRKNGEIFQIELKTEILTLENGSKARLALANDITDRLNHIKEIEKQNTILRDIAWTQSHVVRAPVARIKGLIEILHSFHAKQVDEDTKDLLYKLMEEANELDDIIHKIINKTIHDE
jgi:PAS domain S-box-containing protein